MKEREDPFSQRQGWSSPALPRTHKRPDSLNATVGLPHLAPSCARQCQETLPFQLLQLVLGRDACPTPAHGPLNTSCACLVGPLDTLRLYWDMVPPRGHYAWADATLAALARESWLFTFVRAWGLGWPWLVDVHDEYDEYSLCKNMSRRKRQAWVDAGWATEGDFAKCHIPTMKELNETWEQGIKETRMRAQYRTWRNCIVTYPREGLDADDCERYRPEGDESEWMHAYA